MESTRGRGVEPGPELDRLAHEVIGAAIEVHRQLGPGYLEAVYESALSHELSLRGIQHVRQAVFNVMYKDQKVGEGRVDLFVDSALIVELKAVESVSPLFTAQTISYLKATGARLGLLINFNMPVLKDGVKRIIL